MFSCKTKIGASASLAIVLFLGSQDLALAQTAGSTNTAQALTNLPPNKLLRLGENQSAILFSIRENNAFVLEFGAVTKFSKIQEKDLKLKIANIAALGKDPGRAIAPVPGPVFDETGLWLRNRLLPRDIQVIVHDGVVFVEGKNSESVRVGEVPQFKGLKSEDLRVGREIKNKKVIQDVLGCVSAYLTRLDAGLTDAELKDSVPSEAQKLSETQKAILFTIPRNGSCLIELGEVSVETGEAALNSKFFDHDPYGPWKNARVVAPVATDIWVENSILGGDLKLVLENGKATLFKLTIKNNGNTPPTEKEVGSCTLEEFQEVSRSGKLGDILSRNSTLKLFELVQSHRAAELASNGSSDSSGYTGPSAIK